MSKADDALARALGLISTPAGPARESRIVGLADWLTGRKTERRRDEVEMTLLSLAFLGSRKLAAVTRLTGVPLRTFATTDDGEPLPLDDPSEFAALLLGCGANGDGESARLVAHQVTGCGPDTTAQTLAVLVRVAEASGITAANGPRAARGEDPQGPPDNEREPERKPEREG